MPCSSLGIANAAEVTKVNECKIQAISSLASKVNLTSLTSDYLCFRPLNGLQARIKENDIDRQTHFKDSCPKFYAE